MTFLFTKPCEKISSMAIYLKEEDCALQRPHEIYAPVMIREDLTQFKQIQLGQRDQKNMNGT